ncbi:MAG: hypothetical protein IJ400_05270 [Clostridia bacterium]|nr:hypothetical protein [Clostridia bacterium]
MSVVVAVKRDGVVYMGADTQTTSGMAKTTYLKESNLKIRVFDNGIILGHVGSVAKKSIIAHSKNIIPKLKLENGVLTKRVIVEQLIPMLKKEEVFFDKEEGQIDVSALVAYKDKLFRLRNETVTEICEFCSIGSGTNFAWTQLESFHKKLDPVSLLIKSMDASARNITSVSAPFVVVNTRDMKIEVVK